MNAVRFALAVAALQLFAGLAHACLFARDTQPRDWYAWASALFSGDVTSVEHDAAKSLDTITVRVAETFKGAHVLVALNPNGDTFVVPLTAAYTERLRQDRE